jgi:hypothetical protein
MKSDLLNLKQSLGTKTGPFCAGGCAHLFVEALLVLLMDESILHAPRTNCHYRTNTSNDANLVERRVEDSLMEPKNVIELLEGIWNSCNARVKQELNVRARRHGRRGAWISILASGPSPCAALPSTVAVRRDGDKRSMKLIVPTRTSWCLCVLSTVVKCGDAKQRRTKE